MLIMILLLQRKVRMIRTNNERNNNINNDSNIFLNNNMENNIDLITNANNVYTTSRNWTYDSNTKQYFEEGTIYNRKNFRMFVK